MMAYDENAAPQLGGKSKSTASSKAKGQKTIEETYTKKTQLEHILLRPDTYVGSVEKQTQPMWVFDSATKQMVHRQVTFVPGLYKIFDEIIVNASDNKQRDPSMTRIEVTIDPTNGSIRVWNNGTGVPIVVHQEHKIYVPELIFGNLLTGSNFDDEEEKTTGGRNGYGAKLANIFSTEFIVETAEKARGLRYRQIFRDNMGVKGTPDLSKYASGDDFTCITFYPDLRRFKMQHLDDDIVALLSKRVYDIAGTTTAPGPKLSVYLNGVRVEARNFQQYIGLYRGLEPACAFERVNERWEIGVGVSDGTFQQVSFVNSICTMKGGCHVNYIADQITSKLAAVVKKKNKGQEVKPNQIKNHLAIYVNALIVNPAFDSQTKETLTTKSSSFGSTCVVSDKILKAIEKSGIIDNILNWAKFKQTAELKKKGGSKRSKLIGITKLDDANYAGTARSRDCTLILTEGDSAKALAISGLGVVGRDYYGVFPLKGKLLNVREASHQQMMKNEEIQNIAKILGLTFGRDYEDASSLRYGHLMIMTDQDHDGSHIKGLLINFLHYFWPSLLRIDGFLQQFITPIVKCTKGNKEHTFFTIPQYQAWKEENGESKGWKIKYYKGLGTSTSAEAKEYFSHLGTHQIDFEWDDSTNDMVDMAFAKKRVDDRKLWLLGLEPGMHIDYDVDRISYNDFVNKELILFSHADNERSIPHFMDGLKPSQRKVLFSCFKRNLKQEIKVVQLAGYISEHSAYHHGEASLTQTIIGMAQNFVGSNNINFLSPCGQFGTRLMGGKDAASPRYVFTKLEAITRCIFHPDDDPLLNYLDDDGQSIEPECYVPIIPTVLVNGSEGIGTGWSTSVPTYSPREIIANIRLMIAGQPPQEMKPWFRGFIGDVQAKTGKDCNNFVVAGVMEQVDEGTVIIRELPVGKWTTDYKQFLESVLVGAAPTPAANKEDGAASAAVVPFIKDFKENHTDTTVLFTVSMAPEKLTEALEDKAGIYKKFKLEGSVATSNMHMFDMNQQIRKFDSAAEILTAFYDVRVRYYDKRKEHLIGKLTADWEKLDNKVRFILAVIGGKLVVSNRKKAELLQELKQKGFKTFVDKKGSNKGVEGEEEVDADGDAILVLSDSDLDRGFDYLLSMKIWSLTLERVQALTAQRDAKRAELEELMSKGAEDLWLDDLDALEAALDVFEAEIEEGKKQEEKARSKASGDRAVTMAGKAAGRGVAKGRGGGKGKAAAAAAADSEDDFIEEDDSDFSDDDGFAKKKKKAPAKKAGNSKSSASASAALPANVRGVLIPRKVVIERTVSSMSADSASGTVRVVKPKVAKAVVKAATTAVFGMDDVVDSEEEAESEAMHVPLLQRLNAKHGLSASSATTAVAASAAPAKKATAASKPKSAAPVSKPKTKATKKVKGQDSDEDDGLEDTEEEEMEERDAFQEMMKSSRAPRAAAVAAKSKTVIDIISDSEAEMEEDEEDDDEDEEDDYDSAVQSESDFIDSEDEGRNKNKKKQPPAAKKAAPAPVAAPASKATKKPVATTLFPTTAKSTAAVKETAVAPKGTKRPPKKKSSDFDDDDDDFEDAFVPNTPSPMVAKKARKVPVAKAAAGAGGGTAKEPKAAAAKKAAKEPKEIKEPKPKATKSASASAAAKPTKTVAAAAAAAGGKKAKKSKGSDDEEDEDDVWDGSDDEVVVKRTPKPARQRKTTTYATYFEEEEEEEDDLVDSEESDY